VIQICSDKLGNFRNLLMDKLLNLLNNWLPMIQKARSGNLRCKFINSSDALPFLQRSIQNVSQVVYQNCSQVVYRNVCQKCYQNFY